MCIADSAISILDSCHDTVQNGNHATDSAERNYPFYVPREFAEELDALYNRYDGKNKIEGGDGLEKHREFLFPIMQAAIEELDLEEVVDWEPDDDSK